MRISGCFNRDLRAIGLGSAMSLALSGIVSAAHCDTMDGPVVAAARVALEKGDIAPVLKWVKPEREKEIRAAFARTLSVRAGGPEAKELADMYFFETLVRVHRAGEGAPLHGSSACRDSDRAVHQPRRQGARLGKRGQPGQVPDRPRRGRDPGALRKGRRGEEARRGERGRGP